MALAIGIIKENSGHTVAVTAEHVVGDSEDEREEENEECE